MGEIFDKAKGKIKQAAGKISGNDKLVREGKIDVAKGKAKGVVADVKETAEDVKRKAKNGVEDVKRKAKDATD